MGAAQRLIQNRARGSMPKARRVLAALRRDGWQQVSRKPGSHRKLQRGRAKVTWSYHDGLDLGNTNLEQIADAFGYTLEELRKPCCVGLEQS